ncbi:MAG: terminase small subunit [Stellaceae bacterium]
MTPRQMRFVTEYARLKNAAEAVRRAGYSPFNAAVRGSVLLRSRAVIEALRAKGIDLPLRAPQRSFCRDGAGLTQRQRRFVEQYLILGNASEAARRAGYGAATVKAAGSQLKRSPAIVKALAEANAARARRTRIDAERVLEEVARLSFVDLASLIDWSGDELRLRAPEEIAPEDRAALAQVTVSASKSGKRVTVKLFDKLRALQILMKHLEPGKRKPDAPPQEATIDGRDPRDVLRERLLRLASGKESG